MIRLWIVIVYLLTSFLNGAAFSAAISTENRLQNNSGAQCESVFTLIERRQNVVLDQDLILLRQSYVREVTQLSEVREVMQKNGHTEEEIARTLHKLRRDLGEKYKNLTPSENREIIYSRNLKKYGDKLGPTIEWLRAQGQSWDAIAESASRTGGRDLGL